MTENMKAWLTELYDGAIKEALLAARNEHLWSLGAGTDEVARLHEENAEEQKGYAAILARLKDAVGSMA